jgi:hypothetical protein
LLKTANGCFLPRFLREVIFIFFVIARFRKKSWQSIENINSILFNPMLKYGVEKLENENLEMI